MRYNITIAGFSYGMLPDKEFALSHAKSVSKSEPTRLVSVWDTYNDTLVAEFRNEERIL